MSNKRPHIVLFNPDQWRSDVLGHMGNPAASTPVLDGLVGTEAVSFRQAFCQGTVCTPSRCSFMTGWYPHVRGHRTMFHMLHREQGETSLLEVMKQNGYFVWWGGKNDLIPGGSDTRPICDVRSHGGPEVAKAHGLTWREDSHAVQDWRGRPEGDNYYSFYRGRLEKGGEPIYADSDWCDVLAAIDFIREYRGEQPIFLYLSIGYPHPPYAVEEHFYSRIDRMKLPARVLPPEGWRGKPAMLRGIAEGQRLQGWTEDRWTELRATYYAQCARVDHQLGLLVEAMRSAGMWDDTALFLFSDHGDYTGDFGLVEKNQNTFEDCLTRVPLVVKPPRWRAAKPRVTTAIAELVDFPATVYDLAGVQPPYWHFGRSLMPVVIGATDEHRDAAFCEGGRLPGETLAMEKESTSSQDPSGLYYPRLRLQGTDDAPYHLKATMCRTADFKYVRRMGVSDELYDLHADPGERNNVIDEPACSVPLAKMKDRTLHWYQETCDVVPPMPDRR